MLDAKSSDAKVELMTIGYEGASIDDFVETLKFSSVSTLIDIRELLLSRKKGFSKTALSDALLNNGIEYIHLKALGDPKAGRVAAKAGDFATFRKIFNDHLLSEKSQSELEKLIDIAILGGACLLCFERSHKECHRNIVANEITNKANISVKHIGVQKGLATRKCKSTG